MFKRIVGLLTIAVTGLFLSGGAFADITGSAHDFQSELGTGDLCAVCHTPHTSDTSISDAPLWDHEITGTTNYLLYQGVDMQASTSTQPGGISKLCLSCHDGTIGVDSYGAAPAGGSALLQIDVNNVWSRDGVGAGMTDNDLASEHPISISYAADPDLKLASTHTNVKLFSGNVECASCHDVHNETAHTFMLLETNAGSLLCLECHAK